VKVPWLLNFCGQVSSAVRIRRIVTQICTDAPQFVRSCAPQCDHNPCATVSRHAPRPRVSVSVVSVSVGLGLGRSRSRSVSVSMVSVSFSLGLGRSRSRSRSVSVLSDFIPTDHHVQRKLLEIVSVRTDD
jgi:hypothetical protein